MFGQVGKSLLKPIFARQHSGLHRPVALGSPLPAALQELLRLLPALKPMQIPLKPSEVPVFVLYADAYMNLPSSSRAANRWLKEGVPHSVLKGSTNGWGAVFLPPSGRRFSFRSQVPPAVLGGRTATSEAFIFRLEMLAQVLSVIVLAPQVRGHVLCLRDNSSAEHALQKGFFKDSLFTKVLGCFARFLASHSIALSFHRVSSAANASDGVSRDDWLLAASLGCVRRKFDFSGAYDWLQRLPELPEGSLFTTFVKFAEGLSAQSVAEQRARVE